MVRTKQSFADPGTSSINTELKGSKLPIKAVNVSGVQSSPEKRNETIAYVQNFNLSNQKNNIKKQKLVTINLDLIDNDFSNYLQNQLIFTNIEKI
jgi:hypothetical protein